MGTRTTPVRKNTDFVVKSGPVSGSVHLVGRAAGRPPRRPRVGVERGWRKDLAARAGDAAGEDDDHRPAGATACQFRFRPVTKTGEGARSQVVAFVVQ
jgi:hypothetical protein